MVALVGLTSRCIKRGFDAHRKKPRTPVTESLLQGMIPTQPPSKDAQTIRETAKLIRTESRGAFAAVSHQPLLGALLLTSGSAGIWALLQYFPRLF